MLTMSTRCSHESWYQRVTGADLLDSLCNCKTVLRDRRKEYEGGLADVQFFQFLLRNIGCFTGGQSRDTHYLCNLFSIGSDKAMRPQG